MGKFAEFLNEKELTKHKMYTKSDYNYLKNKGYSNSEIKKIWDRDLKDGKEPNKHKIDFKKGPLRSK